MGKISPEKRWNNHKVECFVAYEQSSVRKELQADGLAVIAQIFGKARKITPEEFWGSRAERYASPEYRAFHDKCRLVADTFGLSQHTVLWSCILKGYRPSDERDILDTVGPTVGVVTESTDEAFLRRLLYEAKRIGFYVAQRKGLQEVRHVLLNPVPIATMEPPPMPTSRPSIHKAFRVRLEIPVGYPPEAARELSEEAARLSRELARRLGYPVPKRLRASNLVSQANTLRVSESPLPNNSAYEIIDNIYGESDLEQDQMLRKTINYRRSKLRKRLVTPYLPGTEQSSDTPTRSANSRQKRMRKRQQASD
jgi:hypothetical protein